MNDYVVYMHKCPNNKIYIGITKQIPTKRWKHGNGYKSNIFFYRAIKKYGWENIKHKILFTNLTEEKACEKEIELIKKYKSNNRMFGYNQSAGGEGSNGVIPNEETRLKMSLAKKGKKKDREIIEKIRIANTGKKRTIEQRKRIGESQKGKIVIHNEETKKKISRTMSKPVLCIETNIIYYGTREAERQTGIRCSGICECCNGKLKTAGGYHWEYVN